MLFLLLKKQKKLLYSKIITSKNSVCLKFLNLFTFAVKINAINSFLKATGYFYYETFDVIFYSSFYLKTDFMDQVPIKFKDFLFCELEWLVISLIGLVFINRKDCIIDLKKHLKAFRSN